LLEDEDHKCPTCHEENVSPDKLIINQSVRQSVKDFKNEGLYEKPVKQLSPPYVSSRNVIRLVWFYGA
jgi:E3 ubiquitin-protein ligase RBBP6